MPLPVTEAGHPFCGIQIRSPLATWRRDPRLWWRSRRGENPCHFVLCAGRVSTGSRRDLTVEATVAKATQEIGLSLIAKDDSASPFPISQIP